MMKNLNEFLLPTDMRVLGGTSATRWTDPLINSELSVATFILKFDKSKNF